MVVTNKRKRKDANRIDVSPEIPKRIKVHAQRKFAQGVLCPPIVLPIVQPSREEIRPQVPSAPLDLIQAKRPNTEDFLTFLCYRGTPILPPRLDFFNNAPGIPSTSVEESSVSISQSSTSAPVPFIPFGVRKRALVYPEKNTSLRKLKMAKESARKSGDSVNKSDSDKIRANKAKELRKSNQLKMDKTRQHTVTVHALRKKYQEQKMAKLRAVAFSKISEHSVRSTRSCSTMNSTTTKRPPAKTTTTTTMATVDKKPVQQRLEPKKPMQQTNTTKMLRNRTTGYKPVRPNQKITIVAKRQLRSSVNTISRNIIKPGLGNKLARPLPLRKRSVRKQEDVKIETTKKVEVDNTKTVLKKPATKIVEDVEVTKETPRIMKSTKEDESVEKDANSEFSSDDDKPLLKVSGKKKNKSRIKEVPMKKLKTDVKKEEKIDKVEIKDEVKKPKEETKVVRNVKKVPQKSKSIVKSDVKGLKTVKTDVKIPDVSNDDSDTSKSNRILRPSRKTKEAATLYMELLGQRLNESNNLDEDDLSLDSFPELPNVRKAEQIEMELKAQVKNDSVKNEKSYSDSSTVKPDAKVKRNVLREKVLKKTVEDKVVDEFAGRDYDTSSETPSESDGDLSLYEIDKIKIDKNSSRCKLRSDRKVTDNGKVVKSKKKAMKKVEKSFSDSDEEPLALKISSKGKSDTDVNLKSSTVSEKSSVKIEDKVDGIVNLKDFVNDKKNAESTPIKSDSTNPVPNLEESQKIFGIAKRINFDSESKKLDGKVGKGKDVAKTRSPTKIEKEIKSLSRGRLLLDTDCINPHDLSIFNTQANLAESPKELRNKRRVNMSAEEIEKWLNESCFEPEAIDEDLIISDMELKKYMSENMEKKNKFFDKDSTKKNTDTTDLEMKLQNEPGTSKCERKTIFNQRRSSIRTPTPNKNSPVKNKQAFSPENETSVYSFNLEEHPTPFSSTIFRPTFETPKAKRKSDTYQAKKPKVDKIKKPRKTLNKTTSNAETSTVKNMDEKSLVLTQDPNNSKSSIAVQCDFQNDQSTTKITLPQPNLADFRNMEISTQTEDALANEGHLFYIPLQNSKSGDNISEQLIQGVAVKLGTEGPDGPNQRVIMRAKLVTKAQISNQLGDSTVSVDEALMKNILGGKICDLKNRRLNNPSVPIGTVQPLARLNKSDEKILPKETSTSTSTGQQFRSYLKHSMNDQKIDKGCLDLGKNHDMMDAPTFYPSEKQFLDPISFIEQITPIAAKYGLCRIVPPSSFTPECKVADDMRFTAYNQYVNRMMYRFGPSVQEMLAIKKYLATQSITLTHAPFIGGMEIDLPRLYHTVQELGGLKEVIEKKKWHRVAEEMCIPKQTQGSANKLDDIYCKYLLPYDTLSPAERQKLLTEVKNEWSRKEKQYRQKQQEKYNDTDAKQEDTTTIVTTKQSAQNSSDKESDSESSSQSDSESDRDLRECTLKGRNMALSQFFRIARNTMAVWFKNSQPDAKEVESQYWEHVSRRDRHICVHVGSIDSSGCGYGFPAKNSPFAKHPWNLKVLTNNSGSVLRSLGPVMGVTVPTLHVGMLFSACCWYRDPHGLPWIEYLHTGANKIWYGIPDRASSTFREALSVLAPQSVLPQTIWLPSDSAMVPPGELLARQVPLSRTVQRPGEFILVCPKAYTSSLCTGYTVSESVYYATKDWLDSAHDDFKDIQESREPTMFSLEQLLISIASDSRAQDTALRSILEPFRAIVDREKSDRAKLKDLSVAQKFDRAQEIASTSSNNSNKIQPKIKGLDGEHECDVCRTNLFVSMVTHKEEDTTLCLQHAIKHLSTQKKIEKTNSNWMLLYSYSVDELESLFEKVNDKLNEMSSDKGAMKRKKKDK